MCPCLFVLPSLMIYSWGSAHNEFDHSCSSLQFSTAWTSVSIQQVGQYIFLTSLHRQVPQDMFRSLCAYSIHWPLPECISLLSSQKHLVPISLVIPGSVSTHFAPTHPPAQTSIMCSRQTQPTCCLLCTG